MLLNKIKSKIALTNIRIIDIHFLKDIYNGSQTKRRN